MKPILFLSLLFFSFNVLAQQAAADTEERPFLTSVRAAMQSDIRTDAERERDANRLPLETLDFFGLEANMQVIELIPGGGWYTRLLAPALRDNGKLYEAMFVTRLVDSGLLDEPGFDRVEVLEPEIEVSRNEQSGKPTINAFSLGVTGVDAVLTFRNVHNFDLAGRAHMHTAAFDALKPGGTYGVVDHTRRHMQPDDPENGRRVDPVQVIQEVQAAGFELVDYSDLHYRPDDELRYEVGRNSVTGNSDRFTMKFRKPAE